MKKLNLDLFETGFKFPFTGNTHLVIKDYREGVLSLDLDYDELECLENIDGVEDSIRAIKDIQDITYNLSYADIEEEMIGLGKDGLRYLIDDGSLEG